MGAQRYPIEGFGNLTLMVMTWWVVILVTVPMVNVLQKSQTLSMRARDFSLFGGIDSYVFSMQEFI